MVEWHSKSKIEIIKRLETNESGLTQKEAKSRLQEFGPNTIEMEKKTSLFSLLAEQFTSPLVVILIFAAMISFYFGKEIDSMLIITIVILNGVFGFIEVR